MYKQLVVSIQWQHLTPYKYTYNWLSQFIGNLSLHTCNWLSQFSGNLLNKIKCTNNWLSQSSGNISLHTNIRLSQFIGNHSLHTCNWLSQFSGNLLNKIKCTNNWLSQSSGNISLQCLICWSSILRRPITNQLQRFNFLVIYTGGHSIVGKNDLYHFFVSTICSYLLLNGYK